MRGVEGLWNGLWNGLWRGLWRGLWNGLWRGLWNGLWSRLWKGVLAPLESIEQVRHQRPVEHSHQPLGLGGRWAVPRDHAAKHQSEDDDGGRGERRRREDGHERRRERRHAREGLCTSIAGGRCSKM